MVEFQKKMNSNSSDETSNEKQSVSEYIMIMSKRMMTVVIGFSRQSTIHSLSHLAQARNMKQRLFWLSIAFLASIGFLINIINIVEKYFETPVLTNVFHDYRSFVFPDISFCLINPVHFPPQNSREFQNLQNQLMLYEKFKKASHLSNRRNALSSYITMKNYSLDMDLADYLFIQPEIHYSHPVWSAVFYCKYMQSECRYKHFEVRHVWPYGNCFTFNVSRTRQSRDVKNMIKNAWRPDFRIIVYKGLTPPSDFKLDPFNSLNTPSGVLVMVHEANTYPYPDEGIIVDSYTQIDLKITTKIHLNVNNKCDMHRESFRYFDKRSNITSEFFGRQPDCLFEIIQSSVAENCHCLLQNMPILYKFRDLPFCLASEVNFDQINNNNQNSLDQCIVTSFQNLNQNEMNKKCHRDLCSHPTFTTVVSHSKYPAVKERQTQSLWLEMLVKLEKLELKHFNKSDLYLKALKQHLIQQYNINSLSDALAFQRNRSLNFLDENFVDKNFMQIRIVPSSLFMDHIEETLEYTLSRLLGDIGGCVGLWIGASLITIFEFVDLIFRFGDLLASYRYRPGLSDMKSGRNFTAINSFPCQTSQKSHSRKTDLRSKRSYFEKFKYLSENETGDLEDEISNTLMQPLNLIQGSKSYFYRQMCLSDI